MKLGRRKFLGLGSAALVGLTLKSEKKIAGSFVNDSFQMGHLLRDRATFPAAKRIEKVPVIIVGGGIAGLSAAWRLRKRGFTDFVLLEMNQQAGGNARWGENEFTAYPWAAHYVPVPGPKAVCVRELFEDLGVSSTAVGRKASSPLLVSLRKTASSFNASRMSSRTFAKVEPSLFHSNSASLQNLSISIAFPFQTGFVSKASTPAFSIGT